MSQIIMTLSTGGSPQVRGEWDLPSIEKSGTFWGHTFLTFEDLVTNLRGCSLSVSSSTRELPLTSSTLHFHFTFESDLRETREPVLTRVSVMCRKPTFVGSRELGGGTGETLETGSKVPFTSALRGMSSTGYSSCLMEQGATRGGGN